MAFSITRRSAGGVGVPRLSLTDETSATEPITIAEAKAHLRVDQADEDTLITALATAVREAFEQDTGRQLVETTWALALDRFPGSDRTPILIPRPPLTEVVSVTYLDTAGTEQTWAAAEYTVETPAGPKPQRGRLYPAFEQMYPDTADVPGAVTITFKAGYADGAVPEAVKRTLLAAVGTLYLHREEQITGKTVRENATVMRLFRRWQVPVYA